MKARANAGAILALAMGLFTLALMGANCLPKEATLAVAGTVTAAEGGQAIDGIEVTCKATVNGEELSATATSGEAAAEGEGTEDGGAAEPGSYRCELKVPAATGAADDGEGAEDAGEAATDGGEESEEAEAEAVEVEVSFADVDGEENGGSFAAKTETVEVELDGEATLDVTLDPEA